MKKLILSLLILLSVIFSLSVTLSASAEWRIDAVGDGIPFNFRTMKDPWHIKVTGEAPSREKMGALRISASAQPAKNEFAPLAERLNQLAVNGPIYVVDLRQESHGFADGYSIFFHGKRNLANFGIKTREALVKEYNELKLLLHKENKFTYSGKNDTKALKKEVITLTPKDIKTEAEVTKAAGLRYVRFACPDQMRPDDDTIDEYIAFVNALPKNSWLHFHCQSGHGRTTTFLVFSEILANPKIPLETIVKRQYLLGGTDLLDEADDNAWKSEEKLRRKDMLIKFHEYANQLDDGKTALKWSEWIKNQK